MFDLVREAIDVAGLRSSVACEKDGAVVIFEGIVRNHSHGRKVRFLEYSAYEEMALKELERVYHVKENALKVRLFRARQRVLKALSRERSSQGAASNRG